MNDNNYTEYDKTEYVEHEIRPRLDMIRNDCKLHGVPFLAVVATANGSVGKNNEKTTKYRYSAVLTGSSEIKLYDDKFTEMELIMAGMKAMRPGTLGPDSFNGDGINYIQDVPNDNQFSESMIDLSTI